MCLLSLDRHKSTRNTSSHILGVEARTSRIETSCHFISLAVCMYCQWLSSAYSLYDHVNALHTREPVQNSRVLILLKFQKQECVLVLKGPALPRESLQRDRPGGLTSPAPHAYSSASPFCARYRHYIRNQVLSSSLVQMQPRAAVPPATDVTHTSIHKHMQCTRSYNGNSYREHHKRQHLFQQIVRECI